VTERLKTVPVELLTEAGTKEGELKLVSSPIDDGSIHAHQVPSLPLCGNYTNDYTALM
jgi:hypothetical protein